MNKYIHKENINIGITQGDFNGVSYELVIKSLKEEIVEPYTPIFFGTSKLVSYFRKIVQANNFNFNLSKDNSFIKRKPNLINIYSPEVKVNIGNKSTEAAELAIISLDNALDFVNSGKIDAIVCCPITKGLINDIVNDFESNGKYLLRKCNVNEYMTLFCNENIRIVSLEYDLPQGDIGSVFNFNFLLDKIKYLNRVLKDDFKLSIPKIAVLAHNNVSNNGTFDKEEEHIIANAIDEATSTGQICVYGPYDFNQLFLGNEYLAFDAILTLSQQQSNTIFTLLNGMNGYLYTAGLPFVVTETYHDSMYNIAGQNVVDITAFKQALHAARFITLNKLELQELKVNKLEIIEEQD